MAAHEPIVRDQNLDYLRNTFKAMKLGTSYYCIFVSVTLQGLRHSSIGHYSSNVHV